MSYQVSLVKDDRPVTVARHCEGAVYAIGGETAAEITITRNYSLIYDQHNFSLRELHGKPARLTLCELARVLAEIGTTEPHADYWAGTPGNAGRALLILLGWAADNLDAVWDVRG